MMAAMEMTDDTPMMIPTTVNAERTFDDRSASSAEKRFSRAWEGVITAMSLRPHSDHRVHLRGPQRRIDAKKQPNYRTHDHSGNRHPGLHRGGEGAEGPQSQRRQKSQGNAHQTSGQTLHHAFRHELAENIHPGRAHGAAHADLLASRAHADQHHVHDDNAAHHYGNHADQDEDGKESRADAPPQGHIALFGSDKEVVLHVSGEVAARA